MLAFLLVAAAQFFNEIGTSLGKYHVQRRQQSLYTLGFLNTLSGAIFFLAIIFFIRKEFIFSFTSLPTFAIRAVLEILQAHFTFLAIVKATRSTFSFIRVLTIPLLLLVDIFLGYSLKLNQIIGIILIVATLFLLILLTSQGLEKRGRWLVLFTAVNAVITISLFKYNITHFNSVEAEQSLISFLLVIYFLLMATIVKKENLLFFLKQPVFLAQSLAIGIGEVGLSFAYLFSSASVITALKRSLTVLFAIISGHFYFQEKYLILKFAAFLLIISGLLLIII